MRELIIRTLRNIDFGNRYRCLCNSHCDFVNRINLKRKDFEGIINLHNLDFEYISKDATFLKEFSYEQYVVRLFIGFKGGIVDFSYLIWEQENSSNYYKGRLASLAEMIDPEFEQSGQYKTPIASSVKEFKVICNEFMRLLEDFEICFFKVVNVNGKNANSKSIF